MGLPQSEPIYTTEEYLRLERESEEKHEFLDGLVYAMAGESLEHNRICNNLNGLLYMQLRGKTCETLSKDIKVRSGPDPRPKATIKGLYSYPDLLVVCGEPKFHDKYQDVLLNPTVIIEVLLPTTEAYDRVEKFSYYRHYLPSLVDYILVAQDRPLVEHHHRIETNRWETVYIDRLEDSFFIDSIGCRLQLAEIYERVSFPVKAVDEEVNEEETEIKE
jgi:Uma2 family endonuclease